MRDFHEPAARGRVILGSTDTRVAHRSRGRWREQIIKAARLQRDRQNAHSFRHPYARLRRKMGARLEELQRFLGHASINTTEGSYGWLTEQSAAARVRTSGAL